MKTYTVRFNSGNPTLVTGLNPTLPYFSVANTGQTLVGPTISEINSGWGIYQFQWGTTTPIAFLADGATSSLGSNRYVTGQLDPSDRSDEYGTTLVAIGTSNIALGTTNVALGTTNVAIGTSILSAVGGSALNSLVTLIGSTLSSFGDSVTDPNTLFGYLRRNMELMEGQQNYLKGAGSWNMYDRSGATLLRTRTIANSVSTVIRS